MGNIEHWLPVVGFEGLYEVSSHGRVKTIKTGLIKKPTLSKKEKRLCVMLWKNNKNKLMKVHRLVLFSFVGQPPEKYECCHNDGDYTNNNLSNLRWDTAQNNQLDRIKHGTSNRGERCASAKLTEIQVIRIRNDTRKHKEIAAEYGIRESQVSRIKNRQRWAHIP